MKSLNSEAGGSCRGGARGWYYLLILCVTLCAALPLMAQQLTGTLSGTVLDASGAAVPQAQVSMRNNVSGDIRSTVSNAVGYFSITAVQPGDYSVSIKASSFKEWRVNNIHFSQGDNRALPKINLEVGEATQTVEVSAEGVLVALDQAEVSTSLNTRLIEDAPLLGRNAGELLKVVPGVTATNGLTQGSSFSGKVVGTNTGPVGAFSVNGTQPNGSMAYMLDGANLVDPGNMGTQIANINPEMTQEVKVLTSSYDAEYAKGPVIFQAFSKSGGKSYHGEAYTFVRNSMFNSWDSYASNQMTVARADPKSTPDKLRSLSSALHGDESFYYMGGNFGGPVRLPFTDFNKDHNKLFFWVGYEYMKQNPAGQVINYNVPTPAQLSGDFSNAGVPQGAKDAWNAAYSTPKVNGNPTTSIPQSMWDPNILGILKLYPAPNATPTSTNGWANYQFANNAPQNRWEATGKVDYAINDNNKVSFTYTRQNENDQHPIAVWWAPAWTLPYPSPVVAATNSQEILTNYTHVFSPSTTNEFVFTLARYINPSTLTNPAAVDRTKLGFNVQGLFGHTTKQIPNFYSPWGGAIPDIREFSFDGSFNGGAFGGLKRDPAIYDNFSKVVNSHTLKFGFYWDTQENIQSSSSQDNGAFQFDAGANNSTGNVIADLLLGRPKSYSQSSAVPVDDVKFHQWSLYGQDSWKATQKLTLNFGLRFDHVGQWYGIPTGIQVFDPASYSNATNAPANTGLLWHAINSSVPSSGFTSPTFYYEPRFGFAYDLFGTGRTVVRGGAAVFRYQISTQVCSNGACDGPAGTVNFTTGTPITGYSSISTFTPPSASKENGTTIAALKRGDDNVPQVVDYNLTISQALPWKTVFEASYVGNKSTHQFLNGANDKVSDINAVPLGALFQRDPNPNSSNFNQFVNPGTSNNDFRPMQNYQDVYLLTHGGYANYNSLQLSWMKRSGPVWFITNYSFSKVLGTRDGQTDNGAGNGRAVDPFVLKNNYGVLAYDHTNVLNFTYGWNIPNFVHGNRFLEEAINGWEISGFTTFQSGAPIQPNSGGNLNAQWPNSLPLKLPNGLSVAGMNPGNWFGSDAPQVIVPRLVCDPRSGLSSGQYFNPSCFAPPAQGQQGNLIWPYIKGPGYKDSDLALFKSFKISESQNLQFRVQAINFLNHPLPQFCLSSCGDDLTLSFVGANNTDNTMLSQTNTNLPKPTGPNQSLQGGTTGKPHFTTGSRTITFSVKYHF